MPDKNKGVPVIRLPWEVFAALLRRTIDNCHFNGTVEITDANNFFTGGIAETWLRVLLKAIQQL
jgi:hypothetical protein